MSIIAPAILAENLEQYKEQIDRVSAFTQRAHIDVSDGIFAPNVTVKPDEIWWPEEWEVDIHAMIMNPVDYLATLVSLKPSMVIIHAEAQGELGSVLQTFKQYDIKAGIALLRHTVPSDVEQLIKLADHVMVFTGDLGRYGGTASLMQLEKVRLIKQINPMAEIGWDGGVSIENAYTLTQGGVNVLTSGGAIQRAENPQEVYNQLVQEINKKGVI